jgi:hypothetical protein
VKCIEVFFYEDRCVRRVSFVFFVLQKILEYKVHEVPKAIGTQRALSFENGDIVDIWGHSL